jgi:hypothetical protein
MATTRLKKRGERKEEEGGENKGERWENAAPTKQCLISSECVKMYNQL